MLCSESSTVKLIVIDVDGNGRSEVVELGESPEGRSTCMKENANY
jgi:hypothetical protein